MYYRSKRTDKQNIIFLWPLTSNKFNLTFSLALFLFYHCLFTYCTHFSVLRWITSNVNSPTTWWQFLPNRAFKLFSNLYTWCNVQQLLSFQTVYNQKLLQYAYYFLPQLRPLIVSPPHQLLTFQLSTIQFLELVYFLFQKSKNLDVSTAILTQKKLLETSPAKSVGLTLSGL